MTIYFCDGSQRGMGIGIGIVQQDDNGFLEYFHYEKIHPFATPLLAECYAIYKALDTAEENKESRITIYSDSLELVQLLKHERIYKNNEFTAVFEPNERRTIPIMDKLKIRINYLYTVKKVKDVFINHYDKSTHEHVPYMNIAHIASREYIRTLPEFFLNDGDKQKIEKHLSKSKLNKRNLFHETNARMSEEEFSKEFKTEKNLSVTIEAHAIESEENQSSWKAIISCDELEQQIQCTEKNLAEALYAAINKLKSKNVNATLFVEKHILKILKALSNMDDNHSVQEKIDYLLSILNENLTLKK